MVASAPELFVKARVVNTWKRRKSWSSVLGTNPHGGKNELEMPTHLNWPLRMLDECQWHCQSLPLWRLVSFPLSSPVLSPQRWGPECAAPPLIPADVGKSVYREKLVLNWLSSQLPQILLDYHFCFQTKLPRWTSMNRWKVLRIKFTPAFTRARTVQSQERTWSFMVTFGSQLKPKLMIIHAYTLRLKVWKAFRSAWLPQAQVIRTTPMFQDLDQ